MKNKYIFFGIIAAVFVVIFWIMGFYNGVVRLGQNVDGQWAQVETVYQRRFDLIPNLVESVKGIFEQEQEVFGKLAEARARYSGAATANEKAAAATGVESALSRLLVIVENYPQLRSAESVTNLMSQLEGTENRISVERQRFNEFVRDYNTKIKVFPGNVFAGMFGFRERAFFEALSGAEEAPEVKF